MADVTSSTSGSASTTDFSITGDFVLPDNAQPSQRLRTRFNEVAKEFGDDFTWAVDTHNFLKIDQDEITFGESGNAKYSTNTSLLTADIKAVFVKLEAERRAMVSESIAGIHWFTYTVHQDSAVPAGEEATAISLANLTPAEKKAAILFRDKVRPIINRIEAKQQDPQALSYADYVNKNGTENDKKVYAVIHHDACVGGKYMGDPKYSLLPYYPDLPAVSGMFATDVSMNDFKAYATTANPSDEILRPSTILTKVNGKIVGTPLPLALGFREDHQDLIKSLNEIANIDGLDSLLKKQLRKWSKFFRTGSAKDEAAAAQATIDAGNSKGHLRVHIGPSESYWDDNTKFPYLLQVGVISDEFKNTLSKLSTDFPQLENSLSGLGSYQPRTLSVRGGFADPIYEIVTGGFIDSFAFAPAGNNFPNYTPYQETYGVKGSNRFILLEAIGLSPSVQPPQLQNLATLLTEDATHWDLRNDSLVFITEHESGHLLGPPRSFITPDKTPMGLAFGKHWGSADEPKADLTFVAELQLRFNRHEIEEAAVAQSLHVIVSRTLGKFYKGKEALASASIRDHQFGATLIAAYFFKTGVYTLQQEADGNTKIKVDYDKMLTSGTDLWRKIIEYQAAGDLSGYLSFAKEVSESVPDSIDAKILAANKGDLPFKINRVWVD